MGKMDGASLILQTLKAQGVDTIFGYPGGAVLPIYDALFEDNAIRHILVRHEQGAVHAAEGYARVTGKPGVVLVTSGPGATNAVTGLTDALMDSVPLVCLTGQVPTHLIGSDAFQECDTTGITRACTKHNYLVKDVAMLERSLQEAFYVATHGRPGPVVVDIPKDVQFAQASAGPAGVQIGHRTYQPRTEPDPEKIERALDMMQKASRPVIYGGGGVINAGTEACEALRAFGDLTGFPVTLTLMGLGAYPADKDQFLGMLGMHGTYEANMAMHESDLIVAVGARFDDRITGRIDAFAPKARKIHIDIDSSSIGKNVLVDLGIIGDAGKALHMLCTQWQKRGSKGANLSSWKAQIEGWRARQCLHFKTQAGVIKPQQAIQRLYEKTKAHDPIISTEVGQHQMWAAQFFRFNAPRRWLTSGGLGTMGYGLPAAIGAQVAEPERLVIDIAGEASILMNIQELATAIQYRLNVKIFIINNRYMGMVRQWQELLHGGRYSESYSDALPDFVALTEAFGGKGLRAEGPEDLDGVIDEMVETPGPVLADIVVDPNENCFPMIPSGKGHHEMLMGDDSPAGQVDDAGKVLV